jgi:hypothetical protein
MALFLVCQDGTPQTSYNHSFRFSVSTMQSGGLYQATHNNMKELTHERTLRHLHEDVSITLRQ